jgi:hypothetical protein
MITAGTYQTKGGYHARVVRDFTERGGTAIITELGRYVAYTGAGEFAYKDEDYAPQSNPGDSLDLIIEREQQS